MARIRIGPIGSDSSVKEEVDRAVARLREQGLDVGGTVQAESLDEQA